MTNKGDVKQLQVVRQLRPPSDHRMIRYDRVGRLARHRGSDPQQINVGARRRAEEGPQWFPWGSDPEDAHGIGI